MKDIFFEYLQQLYNDRENIALVSISTDTDETDDDTAEVVSEAVQHIREANNEKPESSIEKENERPGVIVIGSKSQEDFRDAEKIARLRGTPDIVDYGCTVQVTKLNNGRTYCYNIPKADTPASEWFIPQRIMMGKKVGFEFFCAGSNYRIDSISW